MLKAFIVISGIALFVLLLAADKLLPKSPPTRSPTPTQQAKEETKTVATNLEIPWEIEFLPDKTFFITERRGIVWQFGEDASNKKKVLQLNDVAHVGEGGLLGIVNHPQHEKNGLTYIYYTYQQNGLKNKVVRYGHTGDSLKHNKVIIDNIPGSANHNGGRIKFGPDGKLYITTGDSQNPASAQDLNSLAGKILRINDDGSIPSDNPFGSAVYSYGHRNPQGLAWDSNGRLWATEHGQSMHDEVNIIEKGANFGWPLIQGEQTQPGMKSPYLESGKSTWAPSGAAFDNQVLIFAGLRGAAVFRLDTTSKALSRLFENQFGRIRSINKGPDGFYLLTNNRDGRGSPAQDDDKIIKIKEEHLK